MNHPKYGHLISRIETIHYDPPHPKIDGVGLNVMACKPKVQIFGHMATGVPSAVTCKACKETEVWKEHSKPTEGLSAITMEAAKQLAENLEQMGIGQPPQSTVVDTGPDCCG